jgi:hypothetical protein
MAKSACVRCQNQTFELQEPAVGGSQHKLMFVQCAACGAPAGVVDSYATAVLQQQDLRLHAMQQQLATLEGNVAHIRHVIAALARQRAI